MIGQDAQAADRRRWVEAMHSALLAGNEPAFEEALHHFNALQEISVVTSVRKVTGELQAALEQFRSDSRLIDLAERQVPDARARLAHVLKLTDEAAHHTMDLVDQCCPLVDEVAQQARALLPRLPAAADAREPAPHELAEFLTRTATHMKTVRARLADVLLAQGYQDLSGQIIRSVMKLVDELEIALGDLVRIGDLGGTERPASAAGSARAHGPIVPGVDHGETVGGQDDIDAMLSGMGM